MLQACKFKSFFGYTSFSNKSAWKLLVLSFSLKIGRQDILEI